MWNRRDRQPAPLLIVLALTFLPGLWTPAVVGQEEDEREVHKHRYVFHADRIEPTYAWLVGHGRGYVGVELTGLTPELRRHFGVPEESGVMVGKVLPDSPAERAGLKVADIVTAIDGEPVDSSADVSRLIREKSEGDTVDLEIWRDRRPQSFTVEVAERERKVFKIDNLTISPNAKVVRIPSLEREIRLKAVDGLGTPEATLERLREFFESAEWQEQLHRIESMDWKRVEERMKAVEQKLRSLEAELEKTGGSDEDPP